MNTKERLNKAFDSSADTSTLIHLSTEEASAFVDTIVDQSSLSKKARVVKMDRAKMDIGKLIGSGRFLHAGGHDVALDDSKKDKFGTNKITLVTKELIGAIEIYDDELKHNIEGSTLETRLISLVAKKVGNEIEEIGMYSDTAGTWGATESAFTLFDGWRKKILAGGHVVDASVGYTDQYVEKKKFTKTIKSLPTKFRQGVEFFNHNDIIIDYNELFDSNFNKNTFIDNVLGVPLNPVPNFRFDGLGETESILTNPLNLIMGIQVEDASMSFEKERIASKRKTIYHFQIEVDFAVEEVTAAAILKKLKQR